MNAGVPRQISARELEESSGGSQPGAGGRVLLQMDEGASELNEPLVERPVWAVAVLQPQLLQNIMSFVEHTLIEAFEVTEIVSIKTTPFAFLDQRCNPVAFLAHDGQRDNGFGKGKTQIPRAFGGSSAWQNCA